MENIFYILLAFLGLGFLIFIHELGHYFVAKRVGMTVEVFSIGFGKPFYSWSVDGVKWQLCILPFGGYVRIAGMEKKGSLEPYEIKDGFFGKRPIDRIKVALAGPLVNIFFALLAFSIIWAFGGRDKNFSEYTKKIGYIDANSELYKKEVRPGDEILSYKKRDYTGFSDLIYASVLDGEKCDIKGLKIDYFKKEKTPFVYELDTYKVASSVGGSLNTIGIEYPAAFLMYKDMGNKIFDSPMKDSGIVSGDRIIFANGELLFSIKQLSSLLNENSTFLTVKRGDNFFQVKVPKVRVEEINLNKFDKEEIDDWRHDADIKARLGDLYFLPYYFNEDGVVESNLDFIDEEYSQKISQIEPRNFFSKPLERGDKIVAIDGVKVNSAYDILTLLQKTRVVMIVQRGALLNEKISWKDADKNYDKVFEQNNLSDLVGLIGTPQEKKSLGSLYLLNPVIPVTFEELSSRMGESDLLLQELSNSEKRIQKIDNEEKRNEALSELENVKKEMKLGISFTDKLIKYNPNPFSMFYISLSDIWKTLSSLLSGNLSPKWMSGPIGIVQVIHHSWSLGFLEALFWLGVISLNLGIINLFPVPVLDGGHVVFSLVEVVTKKPIKTKTMERFIIPFIVLLIAAFVFFTYNDILRIIKRFF